MKIYVEVTIKDKDIHYYTNNLKQKEKRKFNMLMYIKQLLRG